MPRIKTGLNSFKGSSKKYILAVARQFFSEYSYLGTSMDDIAQKLNITKAALYYHFKGKSEIYKHVLDEVWSDLRQTISRAIEQSSPQQKLSTLIKSYLDFVSREKNLIKALMVKVSPHDSQIINHIASIREQIINLVQPIVAEALSASESAKKVDIRNLASLLINMMEGLILEYSFFNKKIDSEKISNLIMSAFLLNFS
ncbi:MAG: TetR/AcrR family transcriptional regulator [Candidatus Aminicenantes bacterium]|nr:TetR/AcrR family transcriptional regulator [Candidatus Aminicenantes bacterium]